MTYATLQKLIDRFGADELTQLTDREGLGEIDATVTDRALADADAKINGYLAARYTLPLVTVPTELELLACDIARYLLHDDRMTDLVEQRYKDAIAQLRDVAKGVAVLGVDDSNNVLTGSNTAELSSTTPVFAAAIRRGLSDMAIVVRVDIDDTQVQAMLQRLIAFGARPRDAMEDIAIYGESSTRQRFADQVGPDGVAWLPSQRVQEKGGKTLIKDRHLLDSIVSNAGDNGAEWGANMIYAAIHQFGGEIQKAAQSRLVKHRTNAKGQLLKDDRGLLRFANKKHKRTVSRWFEQGAHTITMPARPYLGINSQDEENILDIINNHLANAANERQF